MVAVELTKQLYFFVISYFWKIFKDELSNEAK